MTDFDDPDYRYLKYDERDPEPAYITNQRGFVLHKHIDGWTMPGATFVSRMLGKIADALSLCHPSKPDLYLDLMRNLHRLSRAVPDKQVEAEVFEFLQCVTDEAEKLAQRLKAIEPRKLGRPKKTAKKPSRAIESLNRTIAREHAQDIKQAI